MSSIEQVITTSFRARGTQAIAAMGQMASGFGRIGGAISENVRQSSKLNDQWRAMGTTIRYAVAGGAVFGLMRLIGQVKDLNVQLGEMQALSDIGSGARYSNSDISTLFQNLQNTAINTITPLSEVNDAATNFLSTVQDVKPSDLPKMLEQIGQGAKLAQTPMDVLTQSATTMQIAFGRAVNPQTIGQFERMWVRLIGIAPGGVSAAPAIAGALPGLASMFQMAPGRGVSPARAQAQMMALTQGVLQTGMPANTALRGLTYLIQSIAMPTGKAKAALAGIGITPTFVAQHGVTAGVMKLLQRIGPVSKTEAGKLGVIPDEQMTEGMNLPGITGAQMTMLRAMVPRIHGERAAIILASQLQSHGKVESLLQAINDMYAVQDEQSKQAQQVAQAWKDLRSHSRLAEAANAIHTMQLEIAQSFEPVLGFAAQHLLTPISKAAQKHQNVVKYGVYAALGLGGIAGVAHFFGRGGGVLGKILGGGGNNLARAQAAEALMSGAQGLGASPATPMFVSVVNDLFGNGRQSPTGDIILPDGTTVPKGSASPASKAFGFLKRVVGYGSPIGVAAKGLGWAGAGTVAAAAAIPLLYNELVKHLVGQSRKIPPGHPLLSKYAGSPYQSGLIVQSAGSRQQSILNQFASGKITADRAEHMLQALQNPGQGGVLLRGRADVHLTLDSTDANGKKQTQKVHVPVTWSNGPIPLYKGKAGKGQR